MTLDGFAVAAAGCLFPIEIPNFGRQEEYDARECEGSYGRDICYLRQYLSDERGLNTLPYAAGYFWYTLSATV